MERLLGLYCKSLARRNGLDKIVIAGVEIPLKSSCKPSLFVIELIQKTLVLLLGFRSTGPALGVTLARRI